MQELPQAILHENLVLESHGGVHEAKVRRQGQPNNVHVDTRGSPEEQQSNEGGGAAGHELEREQSQHSRFQSLRDTRHAAVGTEARVNVAR